MKILYLVHQFYPDFYQGTEKFVLQLAQSCQAAGHEVKVITYDLSKRFTAAPAILPPISMPPILQASILKGTRTYRQRLKSLIGSGLRAIGINRSRLHALVDLLPNRILSAEYLYQGIPVLTFRHQRRPRYFNQQLNDPSLTTFAREVIEREQPDLIHAGHTMWVAEFLQVAQELQLPYLLTLTDYWLLCWKMILINEDRQICDGPRGGQACRLTCTQTFPPHRIEQRQQMAQQFLNRADCVVAPSHFLANKLLAEYPQLPVTIIPHGLASQGFTRNARRYPGTTPLVFCFAGGLFEHKGILLLLAAFQRLSATEIRLQIYGSGPLQGRVQQAEQADKRIRYGGIYEHAQLNERLNGVDVVVLPSFWYENLPLILLEAQACGVPTLVAQIGGMAECVIDGVNGCTFHAGDVNDLQAKLQGMIDQPDLLNTIKRNLAHPIAGQYRVAALDEEVAAYWQLYQRTVIN